MKYGDFFWQHIDVLCSDASLAHSFGEKVWNHQQKEVDELQKRIDIALFLTQGILGGDKAELIAKVREALKG